VVKGELKGAVNDVLANVGPGVDDLRFVPSYGVDSFHVAFVVPYSTHFYRGH
jgi:hypothetical protein